MSNYILEFKTLTAKGKLVKLDLLNTKKAAMLLRAINHKLRQQILTLIDEEGKMTVTEVYEKLFLEQSVASQHLSVLRKAKIVTTTRQGKFIYYSVNASRLEEINDIIASLLK